MRLPWIYSRLFDQFDVNNDRHLSREEVRGLIVGLGIESGLVPNEEVVKDWMKELDINENGKMSQEEFVTGMKKWIASFNLPREKPKRVVKASEPSSAETETPHLFFHNQREVFQLSSLFFIVKHVQVSILLEGSTAVKSGSLV